MSYQNNSTTHTDTPAPVGHNSGTATAADKKAAKAAKRAAKLASEQAAADAHRALIDAVTDTAKAIGSGKAAAVQALHKAGVTEGMEYKNVPDELRAAFTVGYIAGRMPCDTVEAAKIMNAGGATGTGKLKASNGGRRRTGAEEKVCQAGRKMWSDVLAMAGVVTGKAAPDRAPSPGTASPGKVTVTGPDDTEDKTAPEAVTVGDMLATLHRNATTMLAYIQKNAGVSSGDKLATIGAYKMAVTAFHRAIMEADKL